MFFYMKMYLDLKMLIFTFVQHFISLPNIYKCIKPRK